MTSSEPPQTKEWLIELLTDEEPFRHPDFAQRSATNWMRALRTEIEQQHGHDMATQGSACAAHFFGLSRRTDIPSRRAIYAPLFASIVYGMALVSLAETAAVDAWMCPGAVIQWYYAIYNGMRSILASMQGPVPDTHRGVANAMKGAIQKMLPHPLNMYAEWVKNEEFRPELPDYPQMSLQGGSPSPLVQAFDGTRDQSQRMILSYVGGSATWYADARKRDMLKGEFKKRGWTNFRTNAAREYRDEQFKNLQCNFLHVAIRYRGKANYRDPIYFAYGSDTLSSSNKFIGDLAFVARFVAICAIEVARRRLGPATADQFASDMMAHFDGWTRFQTAQL
jgi:hypothetical protein